METPSLTQDVLDRNETVLVELDDGTRLVEIDDRDSYPDRKSYRVESAYGDVVALDDERRAELFIKLYAAVGGFSRDESTQIVVPIDVVTHGKAAVATYLHAVSGLDSETIADRLGVSRRTVWDYWSSIRTDAADRGVEF